MKVFNLQCSAQHAFEGWFASEEDYAHQTGQGMLACPLCGDTAVLKLPSAPRLNLGGATPPKEVAAATPSNQAMLPARDAQALQAAYLQFARRMIEQTEDVGERFADEARRIHYGEVEERGIRGQASPEQTQELLEEGITVLPLPLPEGFNGPLQ